MGNFGYLLLETVPQDTSRVLHDTDVCSDVGLFVLDKRYVFAFPGNVK